MFYVSVSLLQFLLIVVVMATKAAPRLKVIIVPGNGCSANIRGCNWYGWMEDRLSAHTDLFSSVTLRLMPDPVEAKEKVWVPFLINELGADSDTIIIGHSSGAEACMRLMEDTKIFGAVLIAACHTDLGSESEAVSGYYDHPWLWEKQKENVGEEFGILQLHSADDPFIPIQEAEFVAAHLGSDFRRFTDRAHFFSAEDVQDVYEMIVAKIRHCKTALRT